jgi:hypothetical protein
MAIYLTILLILSALFAFACGVREAIFYFKRKSLRTSFRESRSVLVGINPNRKRKVVYETTSIRQQKLSWLIAQNREAIADGLKEFGEAQSVDNTSAYIDTFGIRENLHRHHRLLSEVTKRLGNKFVSLVESTARMIRRTNKRTTLILHTLPGFVIHTFISLRNIIKICWTVGGESDNGNDHSIH